MGWGLCNQTFCSHLESYGVLLLVPSKQPELSSLGLRRHSLNWEKQVGQGAALGATSLQDWEG